MKRYIHSSNSTDTSETDLRSLELDLRNLFEEDPDAMLMYDANSNPEGYSTYTETYTIKDSPSGMKLYRDVIHRYDMETYLLASDSYSVAKFVAKIQPDISKWQHARMVWEIK